MAGDDTEALQSVLECDEEREGLLRRERELLGRSPVDGGWGRSGCEMGGRRGRRRRRDREVEWERNGGRSGGQGKKW